MIITSPKEREFDLEDFLRKEKISLYQFSKIIGKEPGNMQNVLRNKRKVTEYYFNEIMEKYEAYKTKENK